MLQKGVLVFLAFHGLARAGQFVQNQLVLSGSGFKAVFQFADFLFQFFKGTFVLGRLGGNGPFSWGKKAFRRVGGRKSILLKFF